MNGRTRSNRSGLALAALGATLLLSSAAVSAQSAAEDVANLLTGRFFEVEFFVFERSGVMEFNTREILVHQKPQAYPQQLLALPYPDQPFGSGYQIDPMTRLCLTYPTLSYTTTDDDDLTAAYSEQEPQPDPETLLDEPMLEPGNDLSVPAIDPALADVPIAEPADPEQELLDAVTQFELELEAASNQWLPDDTLTLKREAGRVESRAGGRILFHGRWLQAMPPRERPVPVMLPAGAFSGPGNELTGSVEVTLGRYLHFRTRLNYAAPALGAKPPQIAISPTGQSVPIADTATLPSGFMTMAQSRRMRSEQLHYLDHPKLGVVVRIDPVTIPEHLLALKAALEESDQ